MVLQSISPPPPPHPSRLHFKIAVTNCPRSQYYAWPYSSASAAAYLSTDGFLGDCKIRGNLLSKNISKTLKGLGDEAGSYLESRARI